MEKRQNAHRNISTIILSAGLSTRMKQPKLVLPWGKDTILGTVISAFKDAEVGDIVVVTGGSRELVEQEATKHNAKTVFNPKYENGEMVDSLKAGLAKIMDGNSTATFVALADHPFISSHDIRGMIDLYNKGKAKLIVPSYSMRRAHPWLIDRELWPDVMKIEPPDTMREFVNAHSNLIAYYIVEMSKILEDLDTPEDYERLRPQ